MNPTINARRLFVVLLDMLAILAAYYLAFLLRFDFRIDSEAIPIMLKSMPMVLTNDIANCYAFSHNSGIYYYSSFTHLLKIAKAVDSATVASGAFILFMRYHVFPRTVMVLHPILTFLHRRHPLRHPADQELSEHARKLTPRRHVLPSAQSRKASCADAQDPGSQLQGRRF